MRSVVVAFCALAVACPVDPPPPDEGEGEEGEGEGEEGEGEEGEGEGEGEEGEGEGEGEAPTPRFVAVGYGGRRLTSADGSTWINDQQDVANGGDDDDLLRGVCSGVIGGQKIVLAVGGSAQGRVARSVDGGVTWTQIVDDNGWIGACAFSGEEFVFVGSARSARSVDGGLSLIDLENHFIGGQGSWEMRDVIFASNQFIAAGDLGVFVSDDGFGWTDTPAPDGLFRVTSGNGVIVAVGLQTRTSSPDLTSWTTSGTNNAGDVIFAEGRFLIVGDGFRQESTNGVDWSNTANPAMSRVAFGAGVYVGANFPDQRRRSTDGATWENTARDDGNAIDDIIFLE